MILQHMNRNMKLLSILFLAVLFCLSGCNKEFKDLAEVRVYLDIKTSKLNLPQGTTPSFENIHISLYDYNRWSERQEFQLTAADQSFTLIKGRYSNALVNLEVVYTENGAPRRVACYAYMNSNSGPQNFIQDGVTKVVELERGKK